MKKAIREKNNKNELGKKIKELRLQRNLTQTQVAKGVNQFGCKIDQKSLSALEIGTRTIPDYEVLAFAKFFNISFDELFSDFT